MSMNECVFEKLTKFSSDLENKGNNMQTPKQKSGKRKGSFKHTKDPLLVP